MILHAAYPSDAAFRAVDFTGHAGRDCGEHRSTGARARCRDCGEWCSPAEPCAGCERPRNRARLVALEAENAALRAQTEQLDDENLRLREQAGEMAAELDTRRGGVVAP